MVDAGRHSRVGPSPTASVGATSLLAGQLLTLCEHAEVAPVGARASRLPPAAAACHTYAAKAGETPALRPGSHILNSCAAGGHLHYPPSPLAGSPWSSGRSLTEPAAWLRVSQDAPSNEGEQQSSPQTERALCGRVIPAGGLGQRPARARGRPRTCDAGGQADLLPRSIATADHSPAAMVAIVPCVWFATACSAQGNVAEPAYLPGASPATVKLPNEIEESSNGAVFWLSTRPFCALLRDFRGPATAWTVF